MPLLDGFIPTEGSDYNGGIVQNLSALTDLGIRRPYFDKWGKPAVTVNTGRFTYEGGVPVPIRESVQVVELLNRGVIDPVLLTANATSLRKEQWIELDRVVLKEYRLQLTAWADLMAANSFGGFNAMSRMTLEYEAMSDPGEAVVDMDGLSEGRTDSPLNVLRSMPLPITHADFWFSSRRLAVSGANGGTPLDTTMAEACARRIGEKVERVTIGTATGLTYGTQSAGPGAHDGTSTVYGYLTHPDIFLKADFTAPTAGGWVPDTTYNELLTAVAQMKDAGVNGPFRLYYSSDWFKYMARVYSLAGGNTPGETLISMISKVPGLTGVKELQFLPGTFTFILVQMTSNVARAVNGLDITTVQWPSQGGMRSNFKSMCIQVPQVRSTYSGVTGIMKGTTA